MCWMRAAPCRWSRASSARSSAAPSRRRIARSRRGRGRRMPGSAQALIPLEKARANRTAIAWRAEDICAAGIHRRAVSTSEPGFPAGHAARVSSTGRPSFTRGNCAGATRQSLSMKNTASRRGRFSRTRRNCSTRIIAGKLLTAQGVYGLFPANAVGDDVLLYADETRAETRPLFHFLRQQIVKKDGEPSQSLADFIAPLETGLRGSYRRVCGHHRASG